MLWSVTIHMNPFRGTRISSAKHINSLILLTYSLSIMFILSLERDHLTIKDSCEVIFYGGQRNIPAPSRHIGTIIWCLSSVYEAFIFCFLTFNKHLICSTSCELLKNYVRIRTFLCTLFNCGTFRLLRKMQGFVWYMHKVLVCLVLLWS